MSIEATMPQSVASTPVGLEIECQCMGVVFQTVGQTFSLARILANGTQECLPHGRRLRRYLRVSSMLIIL
jgi:hypothetical protein